MNTLVKKVYKAFGQEEKIGFRIPFAIGFSIGKVFDLVSAITGRKFAVSFIKVKSSTVIVCMLLVY